jgi:uncharacterized membrane protein
MSRLTTTVLMAGALVAASLVPVQPVMAGGPPQASSVITLRVCNQSYVTAQVAISYQPVGAGTFSNAGWYNIAPGQCRDLAQTTNAYMYGYAEAPTSGRATIRCVSNTLALTSSGTTARPIATAARKFATSRPCMPKTGASSPGP